MGTVLGARPEFADRVEIHNSDVTSFMKCRRQWHWSSTLPGHRGLTTAEEAPAALWFGSGFHFAMEDWHGYRRFAHPGDALYAYALATAGPTRPEDWLTFVELGITMLDYYCDHWLPARDSYQTLWSAGVPQVEVDFVVPIPGCKGATFGGTFDRVVEDEEQQLWILGYKTAKRIESAKWETDSQVTRYMWAGEQLYGRPVAGVIMQQHLKAVPGGPKRLSKGGFSKDPRKRTSYALYRATLIAEYQLIPEEYIPLLRQIAAQEDETRDAYIRRDLVTRSRAFLEAEPWKLRVVAQEMLDPALPLYPNPTPQCSHLCSFRTPCLALDDDQDWEYLLEANYQHRHEDRTWRERIDYTVVRPPPTPNLVLVDEEDDREF